LVGHKQGIGEANRNFCQPFVSAFGDAQQLALATTMAFDLEPASDEAQARDRRVDEPPFDRRTWLPDHPVEQIVGRDF
jgi:hypothetical protein